MKALVASGVGFSFMSVHGLKEEFRRKRMTKLPITGLPLKRPILVIRHADKQASPVMQAFLQIVQGMFARHQSIERPG